ncbi:iron-containing alcohol dehydrogenase [Candidimonas sp. SYP-B2681]|uniref:iron-containing alcohol dehydrogenase family protein n=1 Tax=Candidimonas sp. SYP-B2681 TaxID=2497686 RepID=UPI000F88E63F|nr:iron-containing alcohol dehydrogenase [Candidimonas sp. SYP-B2681]RTZ43387.1 iron-containing alcohol dehydrogenase [Candidimonas sp. SYP-B2681]
MTIPSIDYHLFGTHVRFGAGCAESLRLELNALGSTLPVVLMQERMAASEAWATLRQTLSGMETRIFTSVPTHSSVQWVESVARDLVDSGCDSIVAIGGGSVSDSAKALSMLLSEGGCLADHATRFTPPSTVEIPSRTRAKLPIISLPTTASAAEVTPSFGVRDGDHKLLFWNRQLASTSVLIDPELSRDIPLKLMRYTAMNGLAHCFEGMYSRNRSLFSDGIALQSVELFAQALTDESMSPNEQRWRLLLAGHLSGVVLSMARTCLHHAICHVIGARHNVGHGEVNTILLPHALRFNEQVASANLAPALVVLNSVSGTGHLSVADWVAAVIQRLDLPSSLSEVGITQDDLPAIAEQTMKERGLAVNPRSVTHSDQVLSILRQAA